MKINNKYEEDEYNLEDDEPDLNSGKSRKHKDSSPEDTDDTDDSADEEYDADEYDPDDDVEIDGDDSPEEAEKKQDQSVVALMMEMMLNPVTGWKRIRRKHLPVEKIASGCFYPLVGIAAASCFMDCVYDSSVTLSMGMISAVKVFVSLFFGNFVALMAIRMFMPGEYKKIPDSDFGKEFVMLMLSTLALFWTLYECLPMLGPILFFLPLWTIYLSMRGARFFRFPEEKKSLLTTLVCVSILGAPFLIYYIFDLFLKN